jgi:hypothetical protein
MRKAFIATVAGIACIALAACGGGGKGIKVGDKHKIGDDATYSLEAADQTSGGKTIKVPEVYLKDKAYIAIHADKDGAPGPVIGVSELLSAGEQKNVKIKLTTPLKDTAKVWPMIHVEDNNNSTYDFPNGDQPAQVDGKVVVVKINIKVR